MIAPARDAYDFDFAANRDREIHTAAKELLANSKYGALRQLECRVFEGVVEISGTVASFYLKQLAQQAMMQLNPAGRVRNLVQVSGETPVSVATSCGPNAA